MNSLRRRNEAKEKVLAVAKEGFFSKGYSDTTIEEIAQAADIGVGTVYNFFNTKAELFIAVISQETDINSEGYELSNADLEKGIGDIVMDFTWGFMGKIKFLSKRMWKDLFAAIFSTRKFGDKLINGLSSLDLKYVERLNEFLEDLKQKSLLPGSFDAKKAAFVIYSILFTHFLLFVYSEEMTLEQMEQQIREQVGFVFEGKC